MVLSLNVPAMAGSGDVEVKATSSVIKMGKAVDFSQEGVIVNATGNAAEIDGTHITLGEATSGAACGVEVANPFSGNTELTAETLADALSNSKDKLNCFVWKRPTNNKVEGNTGEFTYYIAPFTSVAEAEAYVQECSNVGAEIVTTASALTFPINASNTAQYQQNWKASDGIKIMNLAQLIGTGDEKTEVSLPYPKWDNGVTVSTWVKASTDQPAPVFVFQDRSDYYVNKNQYGGLAFYTDGTVLYHEDDNNSSLGNGAKRNSYGAKYSNADTPSKNVGKWVYVTVSIKNDGIKVYYNGKAADLVSNKIVTDYRLGNSAGQYFNYSYGFDTSEDGSGANNFTNSHIMSMQAQRLVLWGSDITEEIATDFSAFLPGKDSAGNISKNIMEYITSETTKLYLGGEDGMSYPWLVANSYGNGGFSGFGYTGASEGMEIKGLTFEAKPVANELETTKSYGEFFEVDYDVTKSIIDTTGNAVTVEDGVITLGEATSGAACGVEVANPFSGNTELTAETLADALSNSKDKLNCFVWKRPTNNKVEGNTGEFTYYIAPFTSVAEAEAYVQECSNVGAEIVTTASALTFPINTSNTAQYQQNWKASDGIKIMNLAQLIGTGDEKTEVSLPYPKWDNGVTVSTWVKASTDQPAPVFVFQDRSDYYVNKNQYGGLAFYTDGTVLYHEDDNNSSLGNGAKRNSYGAKYSNADTPSKNVGKWVYVTVSIKNDGIKVYYNGKAADLVSNKIVTDYRLGKSAGQYFNYSYGFDTSEDGSGANNFTNSDIMSMQAQRLVLWGSDITEEIATDFSAFLPGKDSAGNISKNIMEYITSETTKLYLGGEDGMSYPWLVANSYGNGGFAGFGYTGASEGMAIKGLSFNTKPVENEIIVPDEPDEPEVVVKDSILFDLSAGLVAGTDYDGISVLADMTNIATNDAVEINFNGEVTTCATCISGIDNPKIDGSNVGAGQVPNSGAVVVAKPVTDGSLVVVTRVGKDKVYHFRDSRGTELDTFKNETGANKWYCKVYPVTAGETYYVYGDGTKLTFGGLALVAGTATAELIEAPATTAPAETTAPAVTSAPAATTAPATTSAPAATTAPAATSAPAATTAPATTSAPAATTAPAATSAPAATTAPATTSAPVATTAPAEKTEAPIITKAPIASYDYAYDEDEDTINGVDKLLSDYNNAETAKDEFDNPTLKLGEVPDGEIGQGVRIINPFKGHTELHEDFVKALEKTGLHFNGWTKKAATTNLAGDEYNYVMEAATKEEAIAKFNAENAKKIEEYKRQQITAYAKSVTITGGGVAISGDGVTTSIVAVKTGEDMKLMDIMSVNARVYYQTKDNVKDAPRYDGTTGTVNIANGNNLAKVLNNLNLYVDIDTILSWTDGYITSYEQCLEANKLGKTLDEYIGVSDPATSTSGTYTFPYPTWEKGVTVSTWVKVPAKVTDSAIEATGDAVTEEAVVPATIFEFSDNTASLYMLSDGTVKFMASSDSSSNEGKNVFMATFEGNTPDKLAGEWVYVTLTVANDNIDVYYNGEKATMKTIYGQGATAAKFFNYGTGYGRDNIDERIAECVNNSSYRDLLQNYGTSTTYDDFSKYSFRTTENYLQMVNFLTGEKTNLYLGGNNVVTECSYNDANAGVEFGAINFYDYVVADSVAADQFTAAKAAREHTPIETEEPPVTTAPVTEPPVTTAPATEPPVTTAPATEPPVTTAPVTEPPVTTAPVTEPPVTTPPVTEPPVTTLLGDVNEDGKVELADAVIVLKAALNITQLEGQALINADADGNGKVELSDAVLVLKAALNIVQL